MSDTGNAQGPAETMLEEVGLSTLYDVIMEAGKIGGLVIIQGATPVGWKIVKELGFGKLIGGTLRVVEGEEDVSRLDAELTALNLNVLLL